MSTSSPPSSAAYQTCLNEAFTQSPLVIKHWCSGLAEILHERSTGSVAVHEKRILQDAAVALKANQGVIVEGFVLELTKAIAQHAKASNAKKDEDAPHSFSSLRFDQLELMGDDQVQETLDSARLQQFLMLAADAELADFSARLSTAQGYKTVQADKNPLRPEVFSQALLTLLRRLPVDNGLRSRWLTYGAQLLGKELKALYVLLGKLLEQQGVTQAPYRVLAGVDGQSHKPVSVDAAHDPGSPAYGSSPGGLAGYPLPAAQTWSSQPVDHPTYSGRGRAPDALLDPQALNSSAGRAGIKGAEGSAHISREQLLTLDRLHRLMAGDYDDAFEDAPLGAASYGAAGVQHDFSHTLPAAMDALAELEQQGLVMASRDKVRAKPPLPITLLREQLKTEAKTLGQALSIEVVGLMIQRLTNDERLLAPVRQLIAQAEPAFLHLGLTDPRFFSDKAHPARQLLEAITAKSLAFSSQDAPGFEQFMQHIREVSAVLKEGQLNATQDFAALLADFEDKQHQETPEESMAQEAAVQALLRAEQRNLLAEKIAQEIRVRPDFISGNGAIASFLTGPWAHVMANERLLGEHGGIGSAKAVYSLTLGDLLWSLNTAQASRNRKRLVRIIPGMLNSVREGLLSIDYPLEKSKAFYDALMRSHETAIKSVADRPDNAMRAPEVPEALEKAFETGDRNNSQTNEPWLAPREAQQSGFMEDWKPDDSTDFQATVPGQPLLVPDAQSGREGVASDEAAASSPDSGVELLLGAWVELLSEGRWLRAQLTWISPHNTLFMFTSGGRRSHSMTSRMLQQLLAADRLRVISDQGLLEGALDSVARMAMRNSVDIALDI
ncbi:MAG: DUF1631 family protein [Polaromonas sp.]|nr:MAG: DUF1631 family protein [Polaromonas sp.]